MQYIKDVDMACKCDTRSDMAQDQPTFKGYFHMSQVVMLAKSICSQLIVVFEILRENYLETHTCTC